MIQLASTMCPRWSLVSCQCVHTAGTLKLVLHRVAIHCCLPYEVSGQIYFLFFCTISFSPQAVVQMCSLYMRSQNCSQCFIGWKRADRRGSTVVGLYRYVSSSTEKNQLNWCPSYSFLVLHWRFVKQLGLFICLQFIYCSHLVFMKSFQRSCTASQIK